LYHQFTRELIQLKDFQLHELIKDNQKRWVARLLPMKTTHHCKHCSIKGHIHGRKTRTLRHQWIPGRKDLYVEIPVIRYRCTCCNKTWTPSYEGIPERGQVTDHFKSLVIDYCFGKSIQEVARTINEPYSNVERWYYEKAPTLLPQTDHRKAPHSLCMDELAIRKGHTYALAFMDPASGHIWHMSEGKSRISIQEGMSQWPFATPPKVVVTDLAPGMSETVKEMWPETHIVADKFHVIQLLTQSIERTRRFSQGGQHKHKTIRHQRRLLMTIPEKLKVDEIEKRDILLASSSALQDLYQALQELREMYDQPTQKAGQEHFETWLNTYLFGRTSVLKKVAKTLLKWKTPILNYFVYRLTNGPMEGTNNKIKVLKRRAYGYRNQDHFFTRIRLECKQPA
jgi:transposase